MDIETTFRHESGRAVATLVRLFGDIDIAEEAVQEAFVIAMQRWPNDGTPPNPGAWITTTARNRAIDRLRRESTRNDRQLQAHQLAETQSPDEVDTMIDDRLKLIFTCCHPAIAREAQLALTLRLLGGLTTTEIARAFLVPEPTMAQRITRAKRKISAAGIPYAVPRDAELPNRLSAVLTVIYLIFNEGYLSTSGNEVTRDDLCNEAIRLTRVLCELMPDELEVRSLLALLLLTDSRRTARTDDDDNIVLLEHQDRRLWNRAQIEEGEGTVYALRNNPAPGPFQVQAAIASIHATAASSTDTDWAQIKALYELLLKLQPTPVVALNHAVAVAETGDVTHALELVDALQLTDYYLFHATRANFLARLGRQDEAIAAYSRARELTDNKSEQRFLDRQIKHG